MHFDADLIVLDEPTVALAIKEVRKVLDFVEKIKAQGRACIYIEHNLAHVHERGRPAGGRRPRRDGGRVPPGRDELADLTGFLIDLQHTKAQGVA